MSNFDAWNQLFDKMADRAKKISNEGIYEMIYPLPWEHRSLSSEEKEKAVADYEKCLAMNFRVRDNINELNQNDYVNLLPNLFHNSNPQQIKDIVVEGTLHPRNGELWFGQAPQFQFGSCGVGLNSVDVNIKGKRGGSREGDADWFYTDKDVKLNFTFDIIYTLRVMDALDLRQQLATADLNYDILSIELLDVVDFKQWCLNYNRDKR